MHMLTVFRRRAAHLIRHAAAAMAVVITMAGMASAAFVSPEDTVAVQTLTVQQLSVPTTGTFSFTEPANENFTPVIAADITISNGLWAADRVFDLFEVGGLILGERFVTQNIAGVAHFLYAPANDLGIVAAIPNISGLPVTLITPGETWGPVNLALATPVGGLGTIRVTFVSDGNPTPVGGISDTLILQAVPEPTSAVLLVVGLAGVLGLARRQRRKAG